MPFPSLVGLSLGVLARADTPRGTWAGLLYELLRYTGHSTGRAFGSAALADTGTEPGDVVLLGPNGKVPAALVPEAAAGATGVDNGARQIDGSGAGLSDADIVVAYPDGGRLELAMKLSRAKLGQLVPRVPLPGDEEPGPQITGLQAELAVEVGAAATVSYHVSDPAAAVTVASGNEAVATVAKATDSGTARSVAVTAVTAGSAVIVIEARNAAGTTRATLAVTAVAAGGAPVITGLRPTVAVAVGRTAETPFHVSDPDANVTVATGDQTKATARILGAGTSRRVEVTGVESGFATITVTARNAAGSADAETRATVTAAQTTPTDQADAPTVQNLPAALAVSVGDDLLVPFNVAPDDATVSVGTSDRTVFTVAKEDDAGTGRSLRIRGVAAGDETLTVTVATADGQQSYTRPVAVALGPTAPVIQNLVARRSLYIGSANAVDLDFDVTDPAATVEVAVNGSAVAASLPDNTGGSRTLRLRGVAAGTGIVTVTARNAAGSGSETITGEVIGAPVISSLPLGAAVYAGGVATLGYNLSDGAAVTRVSTSAAATATVAKVDDTGTQRSIRVSGQRPGRATITVEATNPSGTSRQTFAVGVTGAPVISSLSAVETIIEDRYTTRGYRISDRAATTRVTSSDNGIATVAKVDDTGTQRSIRVSGQRPGRATITVEATNPAGTDRAELVVTVEASGVESGDPITPDG